MTSLQGITPEHLDKIEQSAQAEQERRWQRNGTANATILALCTAIRLAWLKRDQALAELARLRAIPLDVPASIQRAADLVRMLYAGSYLSFDQMRPIEHALDEASITIAALERSNATLQQQLAGREGEAAALALAIEAFLDTCPYCRLGQCAADSHQALRAALNPEAGGQLRRLIGQCADAVGDPDLHVPGNPMRSLAIQLLPYRRKGARE